MYLNNVFGLKLLVSMAFCSSHSIKMYENTGANLVHLTGCIHRIQEEGHFAGKVFISVFTTYKIDICTGEAEGS